MEAGLELVREAGTECGLILGQDFSVVVDIGADRLFDQEKHKYELITGQWKSTDDLISMYTELLTSQPGLMGYIDPLHHEDVEGWRKLQEALGSKCLVVADKALASGLLPVPPSDHQGPSPEVEKQESMSGVGEGTPEVTEGLELLSCASFTLETTLSATFSRYRALSGIASYTMLNVPHTLTANPLLVDVAVAMQCSLLRLGAPCGVTSTCLLSRMLQIKEELSSKGTYEPPKALVFSSTSLSKVDQH
jgi:enolase